MGLIGLMALVMVSCARTGSLSGGERDEQPPRLLEVEPPTGATDVQTQRIEMQFDEYVTLKNANSELVVSPPLEQPPEFKLKGKKLIVSWEDSLKENTTYLFQFGNGIVDFNEGNVWDSNLVVFSTGPVIDSLEISGKVVDAYTAQPVPDAWVMLYRENIDSLPKTSLPNYFAKSDENGWFKLRYLRDGNYKIFALVDENGGYKYDVPSELIGFQPELVHPGVAVDSLPDSLSHDFVDFKLRMFKAEDTLQYLKSYEQNDAYGLRFIFNRPVDSLKLEELTRQQDPDQWLQSWSKTRDTLVVWFPESFAYDSLWVRLEAQALEDTLFLTKPGDSGRGKSKKSDKDDKPFSLNSNAGTKLRHFKPWVFKAKAPLDTAVDWSRITFTEGNDTVPIKGSIEGSIMVVDFPWKQDKRYGLHIPDSTIYDRYARTHDTLEFNVTTSRQEDFGEAVIAYQLPPAPQYIWELIGGESKLVDRRVINEPTGTIQHQYLPPGSYQIRLVIDANANGQWDTGLYPSRQPESVIYFDQSVDVRENWVTELDWTILPQSR